MHFSISDKAINRIAEDYAIRRRNRITDEYPEDRNQFDEKQFSYAPIGKTPILIHGEEIDNYFINLPHILKLWQKITFISSYFSYHLVLAL